jgi:alpha-mannosidase
MEWGLLELSNSQVSLAALKVAHSHTELQEIVLRLFNPFIASQLQVPIQVSVPVDSVREINGMEQPVGESASVHQVDDQSAALDLAPYDLKSLKILIRR